MCLAVPVLIEAVNGSDARVEIGGVRRTVSIALTPEAKTGDYILVHAGYAIGLLDEGEARETLKLFEQMAALSDGEEEGAPEPGRGAI